MTGGMQPNAPHLLDNCRVGVHGPTVSLRDPRWQLALCLEAHLHQIWGQTAITGEG